RLVGNGTIEATFELIKKEIEQYLLPA
ncbi:MAG: hypothetical protein RLZ39_475, partial [Bacteroidota bacterium]